MTGMSKNEQKKFLSAVSKGIVCSPKMKKQFLNDLSSSIEDFQKYSDEECSVAEHFGTAEQIALDFMETVDPTEVQLYEKISIAKQRGVILGSILITIALISTTLNYYFNGANTESSEITTVIYAEDPAPDNFLTENLTEDSKTAIDSINTIQ